MARERSLFNWDKLGWVNWWIGWWLLIVDQKRKNQPELYQNITAWKLAKFQEVRLWSNHVCSKGSEIPVLNESGL